MPQGSGNTSGSGTQQVVNLGEVREKRMDEKRRKAERIFFKHLLGVYCVTGQAEMRPVEIVEVSEEGCSLQVPFENGNPWPKDDTEIPLRLYFSQDTYIPIQLKIVNSRPCIENGLRYVRYGCEVDRSVSSYPAYQQFVRFLGLYSEHARKDKGDVTVFYL